MDHLLLQGEARHCRDCDLVTIFVPVERDTWCCTACDAAVIVAIEPQARRHAA